MSSHSAGRPVESFPTDRLIARRFHLDDFETLRQMHHDPRVMATLGGVRSDQETRKFLQDNLDHWDRHGYGLWMFRDQAEDTFVGRGGLKHIEVGGHHEIELGYSVLAEYWGSGFATEMARSIVRIGFERLVLDSIVCFTLTTNPASERVMEKAGFVFERNILHEGQPHVLYRMTSAHYEAG